MIEQANAEWSELHPDPADEAERMLPLIRLRVSSLVSFWFTNKAVLTRMTHDRSIAVESIARGRSSK